MEESGAACWNKRCSVGLCIRVCVGDSGGVCVHTGRDGGVCIETGL